MKTSRLCIFRNLIISTHIFLYKALISCEMLYIGGNPDIQINKISEGTLIKAADEFFDTFQASRLLST